MKNALISIVVPCFNEEKAIPFFIDEIKKIELKMKEKYRVAFEYIFVDDGSFDETEKIIKDYSAKYENIRYIIFSRNFGKEGAIYAGMQKCKGEYVAIMDVDLQDPPSMLLEMYETVTNSDYDAAAARRVTRKGEPLIRSFFARCFYKLINKISQTEIVDGARDFRLMKRGMVDSILTLTEYNRFSKGIFSWVGFKTKWLEYENIERVAGETKWSFFKLLCYSIEGIVAFSTVPLAISLIVGTFFCFTSLVAGIIILILSVTSGTGNVSYAGLICIAFLLAGIGLMCNGIQGQYISKTYTEVKKRPIYIAKEESDDAQKTADFDSCSSNASCNL